MFDTTAATTHRNSAAARLKDAIETENRIHLISFPFFVDFVVV